MRKFTQLYNMISREWTGIASGMDRVKSRITSTKPVLTMLIMLMVGVGNAWGNKVSSANSSSDISGGKIVMTGAGNHATFTFAVTGKTITHNGINYSGMEVGKNSTVKAYFSWTKEADVSIKVTKISLDVTGYINHTQTVFGGTTTDVGSEWGVMKTISASNNSGLSNNVELQLKNTSSGLFGGSRSFYIKDISITYTITPNAPSVTVNPKTASVNVTLNTNSPTNLDVASKFSSSDHYNSRSYTVSTNPGSAGHMNGSNFYATAAGTYVVKAKYNASTGCHEDSEWGEGLTVTVNRLDPTLTYTNGTVDVSVNSTTDKTTLDLSTLKTAYTGNGNISYAFTDGKDHTNGTISGSTFYATEANKTYYITATSTQTGQYAGKTANFTVTVNKRTPTFSWWNEDGKTNIYSGDVLSNVAQAKYNGNNVAGLTYHYSSSNTTVAVVDGTNIRIPSTGFTSAGTTTITVTTDETTYYKAGEATHDYYIEPKATPLFKLNNVDLPEDPIATLNLLIGETANMTFENTDESNGLFTYPTTPKYVSYTHDSEHHSGVIEGKAAGNEYIQFQQTGTTTIFGHTRSIHVFVRKHPVELSTTMNAGTWKVDSIYDGTLYSLSATPEGEEPEQNEVAITSGNKNVIDFVDGHWKAVGAGTSVMTFAMKNNDYWTGDTITATITVEKYTPVITWNLENRYPWGAQKENPVSSSCDLPFTVTSSDPTVANYVGNRLEVYNKSESVTLTLSQPGNYKWNDASANLTKTIECYKPSNHVPFSVLNNNHGNYENYFTTSAEWNSPAYVLGDGGWGTQDDYVVLRFTGVPDKLKFDKTLETSLGQLPGTHLCQVYESADGANWGNAIWKHDERVAEKNGNEVQLSPAAQYVKFAYHGTVYCKYKNIKVLERKEVSAPASVTFPTNSVDATANTQTINVNWYNVKHSTVTITGTNASFFSLADDSHEIASAIDDYGTKALKVTYAYPEGGTHTATLHIESEDGYTADVTLSATSNKLTPAITWKENLTPMSRGNNVGNPATSPVTLVYESSDPTVVKVEGDTLKPLKKGNATITASFDGTTDKKYNSNSNTIDVLVTDMKVLHINWPQTFTRLKYSTEKPEKTTADFELTATVSYFDPDTKEEISIDRDVTFTSSSNAVVQVLPGNILHVAGLGTTTLTAHVDGVENEFVEANVTRAVKVREPSTDCDTYILEDAHNSMFTEINSFNGVETVYELNGEPGYLTFSAWTERWYLGLIPIDPAGDMKVAQYINGAWSDAIWSNGLQIGNEQSFGPIALDRRATKIKFYKEVGSTCYHNFSEGYITLARYVELENTPNKTTLDIAFTTEETKPGIAVVKTFTVNYSNITDQLVIDYEGSNKFTVLSPSSIGEECGDKGTATVQVQFLSDDVDHYEGTITIHNENQSVTINLSADVDKHTQHIDWNPETLSLKTTDDVTFEATTTGSAAGLSVTYVVTNGDAATVNAETGKLTIIKDGDVTIEARAAGNTSYYDATPVPYTFHIDKVTPEITTAPTAATMTMPNTNLGSCGLTGGVATVAGSFTWADNTINATLNNEGYTVVFTPKNTNWYNTVNCTVVVPVNKQVNEITWNFNVAEMYCNADYTFDAYATSGLDVRYETSDNQVAYVDGENHLFIIKGGEVTITAYEDGDGDWAAAEPVSKTFTILRFTPEIVTLPTASSILIGQLLDNASLTEGLAELNGTKVDGGFAWVDGHTTTMNVAGEFVKDIVFNPSNANWFEPVYGTMTVVVEKYAPTILTNTLTATSIEFPNTLSTSDLSGTVTAEDQVKYPSVPVTGHVEWKTPTTILRPGEQTGIALFVPDNSDWYTSVEIPVSVQVTGGYVFNGDNTDWTEENNWAGNLVPTGIDDPVLINEDVDITTSVTVGSLTIKEGVDVVIKDGGVLTIGANDSETRTAYGNMHVENGGQLILGAGELKVNDFTLEAKLGDAENVGMSGQILNPATLKVNGNAYFDLALDPSGACSKGWYDFTVPFPVDALNGVTRFRNSNGEERTITNEVNYAIMDFSESRRLETGYGWKKFRGVMQPGQCYTITIDDVDNVYRFKKTEMGGAFNNQTTASLAYTEVEDNRRGWNGLGNGTMSYINLSAEDIEKVQVYNHSTNSYTAVPMDTFTYVVGSAYFVQAPSLSSVVNYTHGGETHVLRAPLRQGREVKEYTLTLIEENTNHVDDRFYVSASENATNSYTIGRELTKFDNPTESKVAQVWAEAYGMKLCDIEVPLSNSAATCGLNLFAPKAGQYAISVEKAPENTMLYLTYNSRVIWNLSYGPYVMDMSKGTTEGYGLRIVATQQTTTDIETASGDQPSVRKVLIDDVIYIITPEGKMYDITGKDVKY